MCQRVIELAPEAAEIERKAKQETAKEARALMKEMDEFKITPEMIDESDEMGRALSEMSCKDWFRQFTI